MHQSCVAYVLALLEIVIGTFRSNVMHQSCVAYVLALLEIG